MDQVIEGIYSTMDAAIHAIDRLKEEGYNSRDLSVIANADIYGNFSEVIEADTTIQSRTKMDGTGTEESIWEKMRAIFVEPIGKKESFNLETVKQTVVNPLFTFSKEINCGAFVVLVNDDAVRGLSINDKSKGGIL